MVHFDCYSPAVFPVDTRDVLQRVGSSFLFKQPRRISYGPNGRNVIGGREYFLHIRWGTGREGGSRERGVPIGVDQFRAAATTVYIYVALR